MKALHLLDVIASESESWGVQLEETLRNALLLLSLSGKRLTELERLFFEEAFLGSCLAGATDPSLRSFWERYLELSPEKRQAWAMPVLNKVTPLLAVPALRRTLGSGEALDLGALLSRRAQVLLVSLAVDELQRSGRMLGSLVVSAIAREMMARVDVPEKDRKPVRLYVDEFENMASESFEGLIAEGRRFGLTLVLSHQTLSQLPARLRSVVRNNVGVQVLFQCGFEDSQALSREIPAGLLPEGLRGLSTGQAALLRRDGPAELVRFDPPAKALPARAVEAYREEILSRLPEAKEEEEPVKSDPPKKAKARKKKAEDLEEWL